MGLDTPVHLFQPRNWACVKQWDWNPYKPSGKNCFKFNWPPPSQSEFLVKNFGFATQKKRPLFLRQVEQQKLLETVRMIFELFCCVFSNTTSNDGLGLEPKFTFGFSKMHPVFFMKMSAKFALSIRLRFVSKFKSYISQFLKTSHWVWETFSTNLLHGS